MVSRVQVIFCVLLLCISSAICDTADSIDPDADRNMSEIVRNKGYPCNEYQIITSDGYKLLFFRIPHGKSAYNKTGPPVFYFFMDCWILRSLGF